ncbi:MAG: replication factor C large subunit [Candidatus Lokiarchaeota archaeon]|nr:replication factor C large subunit [Candidatus Lokiarchaeota archaeon]
MSNLKTNIPWVEKYRPKSLKDMALPKAKVSGHQVDLAEELTKFVNNFFIEKSKINALNKKIRTHNHTAPDNKQKDEIKLPSEQAAVLLEGDPGIGKTSIVYALANDLNMDVIETNASDTRTRDALEKKLKETTKSRGIMDFVVEAKKKLILIDEVDGIYGNKDRGAVPAIIDLAQETQFPIIMCSNEYKQNLQTLYKKIQRFEVRSLSKPEVIKIAKKILSKEKVTGLTEDDLGLIAEKNNGDLRGVINDLQGISQGQAKKADMSLLSSLRRDTMEEIFSLIRQLFQDVTTIRDARNLTDKSDVDYNFLYKWVSENIPSFIYDNMDLSKAYENLSLADEIFGRIRKNMYWGLLPYFYDLFAGGVAISSRYGASNKGFRRVSNPIYISSTSMTAPQESLYEKIKEKYEISQFEAMQDFVPFLQALSSSSRKQLKILSDWLELDAKEKKLLKSE